MVGSGVPACVVADSPLFRDVLRSSGDAGRSSIEALGSVLLTQDQRCRLPAAAPRRGPGDHYRGPAQALGPGATGCVLSLLLCYHAGQSQRYRPGVTGSSITSPVAVVP